MEDLNIMRRNFNCKINVRKAKKGKNSQLFTRDEYYLFLDRIKTSKNKTSHKIPEDYQRLSKYDIAKIGKEEKLIVPLKNDRDPIIFYVYLEEIFDIIHEIHISIGHRGRSKMMKQLKAKYKNVTAEFVMIYLTLCQTCRKRINIPKKGHVAEPIMSSEFNSICQIDLIDMNSCVDGYYKYIMLYEEHLTKFLQLRALKTKRTKEVANHLLDIFTTFGAPSILKSANGQEFANKVIEKVYGMWEEPKIWHEKPTNSQSQGSVQIIDQGIREMLCTWLETNKTTKWSEGLRYIQFMKNRAHNSEINRSPYEAMFGCTAKVATGSSLPINVLSLDIKNEQNIEEHLVEQEDSVNDVVIKTEYCGSMSDDDSNADLSNDSSSEMKYENQHDASEMDINDVPIDNAVVGEYNKDK